MNKINRKMIDMNCNKHRAVYCASPLFFPNSNPFLLWFSSSINPNAMLFTPIVIGFVRVLTGFKALYMLWRISGLSVWFFPNTKRLKQTRHLRLITPRRCQALHVLYSMCIYNIYIFTSLAPTAASLLGMQFSWFYIIVRDLIFFKIIRVTECMCELGN